MRRYDDYVVIIPIKGDNVLTQSQYKPGAKMKCMGFPAGFVKEGETHYRAALRELNEETGLTGKLKKVGTFYDNASIGEEKFTIYLCFNPTEVKTKLEQDKNESKILNRWKKIKDLKPMPGACMEIARLSINIK